MLKHIQRISCRVNPYCGHEKQHSSRIQYVKRIFLMSAEYFQPLGALPHYHCTATTALQNWCGAVDFGESWHSISSDHCSEVVCKCALYVYWHFRLAYYLPLYCHYYGYCDRPKFLNTTFLFVAKNRHLEKKSIKSSNSISKGEFTSPTITSWSFDVAVLYTDVSASTCFLFPDNKRLLPFCSFVPNAKLPFCFFSKWQSGERTLKSDGAITLWVYERARCFRCGKWMEWSKWESKQVCVWPSCTQCAVQGPRPPPSGTEGVLWMIPLLGQAEPWSCRHLQTTSFPEKNHF